MPHERPLPGHRTLRHAREPPRFLGGSRRTGPSPGRAQSLLAAERGDAGLFGDTGDFGERGETGDFGERGDGAVLGDLGERGDGAVFGDRGEIGDFALFGVGADFGVTGDVAVGAVGELTVGASGAAGNARSPFTAVCCPATAEAARPSWLDRFCVLL